MQLSLSKKDVAQLHVMLSTLSIPPLPVSLKLDVSKMPVRHMYLVWNGYSSDCKGFQVCRLSSEFSFNHCVDVVFLKVELGEYDLWVQDSHNARKGSCDSRTHQKYHWIFRNLHKKVKVVWWQRNWRIISWGVEKVGILCSACSTLIRHPSSVAKCILGSKKYTKMPWIHQDKNI